MKAPFAALALVILAFLVLGLAYARATPAWQAPDEPAHFNYVKYLAERGQLPVLGPGDYPAGLPIGPAVRLDDISDFNYESHQPPLFYALAAVAYKLHPTLAAVRALSIVFGAALLPLIFWCARFALPGQPWLWLGAAAFAGFIPMHLFVAGSANNDTLADFMLSLLLLAYLAVAAGWRDRWRWVVVGGLLGLAMLTKLTIYPAAVLLVLGCVLAELSLMPRLAGALKAAGVMIGVAAVVSGWWFVRNGLIYGWSDMLVQSRQAQVAGSQTHTGAFGLAQLTNWAVGSFYSFWGQFGWMSLPLPSREYVGLLAFAGVVVVGLGVRVRRIQNSKFKVQSGGGGQASSLLAGILPVPLIAWLGLGIVWVGTTGSYLYYNLTFLQTQGRYLFPALAPIAIVCIAGFAGLFPKRVHPGAAIGLSVAMLAFATFTLQHNLTPAFR